VAGAQPLLIHSLVEFDELIEACLDIAGAGSVLEIGSESGESTKRLVAGASGRGGEAWCIEPAPTRELEELDRTEEAFHLVRGISPAALEGIEPCDAYIVDGDHNYWTVSHEMEHLGGTGGTGTHPLVILHDVAWPWARRDLYYSPSALPPEALHPHSWDLGVVPDVDTAVPGGFRGQGSFAVALHEGGARNGVRTAVEDYLDGKDDLRFIVVPAIFGLGVVYSAEAPYASALEEKLGPLDANPLIERLERNRLELYLAVLRTQHEVAELGLRQGRLLAQYDSSITSAETEAAGLRNEVAQLRERLKHVDTETPRRG